MGTHLYSLKSNLQKFKMSRSRSRSPPPRERSSRSPPRRSTIPPPEELFSVMVAGYHYDTTRDELTRFFEKFGEIAEINMPNDYITRKPRGMAFVRFWKKSSQEDVIAQSKERPFEMDGRKLRLEFAYSKPKPGDPRYQRGPPPRRYDDRRGGYDRGGYNPRGDDRRDDRRYDDRRDDYRRDDYRRDDRGYNDRRGGYDDRRGGYDDRRRDDYDRRPTEYGRPRY